MDNEIIVEVLPQSTIEVNIQQPNIFVDVANNLFGFNNVEFNGTTSIVQNSVVFEWSPVPPTRNSPGNPGEMARDDDYIYICYDLNRWGRFILLKGW